MGEGGGFQQYVAGAARNIRLTLLGPEGPTDFQIHSARTSIFSEPTGIVDWKKIICSGGEGRGGWTNGMLTERWIVRTTDVTLDP